MGNSRNSYLAEISHLGYKIIIYPITTIVATIGAALSINKMIKEQDGRPLLMALWFEALRYNEAIAKIEEMIGDRLCGWNARLWKNRGEGAFP